MRPRAFVVATVASIACALAGCTFLVTFDDPPKDGAELSVPDARSPASDVFVPDTNVAPVEDASTPDVVDAAPQPDGAVDYSQACVGKPDSKYCNGGKISVDGGSNDDLVTCLAGKTVSVKLCPNGCETMPTGFADECDECKGKATGLYCGDDFVGWHPGNKNTRIRCDNNVISGSLICTTCGGTGPNAACQ